MRLHWILYVAARYVKSNRKNRGLTSSALSITGIAVGVMALIAVLAVMNGFQLGYIEDILEIRSHHIQISPGNNTGQVLKRIRNIEGVSSAVSFKDTEILIKSEYSQLRGCSIRGLPPDVNEKDKRFIEYLHVIRGSFNLHNSNNIVIGTELARMLGTDVGDTLYVITYSASEGSSLRPERKEFTISGVFRSGYYDFDLGWAFIPIGSIEQLAVSEQMKIGIKLNDRFALSQYVEKIQQVLPEHIEKPVTWREYNKAFFGALRMEKLVMMILLGLIFIVVAANIYHSIKRSVYERQEEIGLLRATGGDTFSIQLIFIAEGFLIGLAGAVIGCLAGLLISVHINNVFSLAEWGINALKMIGEAVFLPILGKGESFALFSPTYFYLTEVPIRIILRETTAIFIFAVISATVAAYIASHRVSQAMPSRILRWE